LGRLTRECVSGSTAGAERAMEALIRMKKIDIAGLERATAGDRVTA
jgi:predicted 3-demethylubiquinone-9 3-methyltransferase (glyoxalase superfamily)